MSDTAVTPDGVATTPDPRATSPFLPPRLLAAATYLRTVTGGMSALPQTIQVMFDGSEQQAPVHLGAEHTLTQLNFSDNFVLKVLDFQFWHF